MSTLEETTTPTAEAPTEPAVHSHDHDHTHDHTHNHDHAPALNPECRREISLEVPATEVDAQFARVLKGYRKQARIPGFRAGKVPESLLRKRFADQIQKDVVEALLPGVFQKEVEQRSLKVVSQPRLLKLDLNEGQPLTFTAEFEVLPEFSVDGYDTVQVEKSDASLTDEEVEQELQALLESRYTMEPLPDDHELAIGDFAQITFQGFFEGVEAPEAGAERAPDLNGRNAMIELGGKDTVEAFTTALLGAKTGQQLSLEVSYPAEFAEKRLAGKSVKYEIEVKGAKQKVVPELDDDLVKELGDYESVDAFRQKFREHLAARKQRMAEGESREKLIRALTEKFPFPVPESMVQQQIDTRLERGLRALAQQGMSPDDMRKLDFGRLREGQREGATHEVRAALVMDKVADAMQVEVEESEMDRELSMASAETREPLETLRKRLTEDGTLLKIREQIRREKAASLLLERQH